MSTFDEVNPSIPLVPTFWGHNTLSLVHIVGWFDPGFEAKINAGVAAFEIACHCKPEGKKRDLQYCSLNENTIRNNAQNGQNGQFLRELQYPMDKETPQVTLWSQSLRTSNQ